MKTNRLIQLLSAILLFTSCVQKAYKKTVIATLTVKNKKDIQSVEVYGNGNPLSWYSGMKLTEVIKDSVYTATIHSVTGFKSTELKFKVDDEWELNEKPNRVVNYSDKSDTTYMNAVFNETQSKN
jgi:hypothetical protein